MNDRRRKSEPSRMNYDLRVKFNDDPPTASAAKRRRQELDMPSLAEHREEGNVVVVEAKIAEKESAAIGKVDGESTVTRTTDSNPVPQKRCSITRGRRSSILRLVDLGSVVENVAEIESTCPKDLPVNERLRDVMRRCAELAFKELDAKLDKSSESAFLAALDNTLDQLMAKGIFKLATRTTTTVLPGLDQKFTQEWEEVIKESETCVERLTSENKCWDEIVRDHEKPRSEQNRRRLNTISDAITTTPGADCEYVVGRMNASMERLGVQMAILSEATDALHHFNARADEHLTTRVNALSGGESIDCKQLLTAVINGSI